MQERLDALSREAATHLEGQEVALRAQEKNIELHVDAVAHALRFATDIATDGTIGEVGVTHATTLARLEAAKKEHAAVDWTPTCDDPVELRAATAEEFAKFLETAVVVVKAPVVDSHTAPGML